MQGWGPRDFQCVSTSLGHVRLSATCDRVGKASEGAHGGGAHTLPCAPYTVPIVCPDTLSRHRPQPPPPPRALLLPGGAPRAEAPLSQCPAPKHSHAIYLGTTLGSEKGGDLCQVTQAQIQMPGPPISDSSLRAPLSSPTPSVLRGTPAPPWARLVLALSVPSPRVASPCCSPGSRLREGRSLPRPPSKEATEMRSGPRPAPPAGSSPAERGWWAARRSVQEPVAPKANPASRACAVHEGWLVCPHRSLSVARAPHVPGSRAEG